MEKTDNWAAFGNEYLKAIEVESNDDEYAIVNVSSQEEDGKTTLILHVQREEVEKKFGCNKTNLQAIQLECNTPKEAIGRTVTFNKVDTQTPKGEPVKGLRIVFKPKEEPSQVDTDEAGIQKDSTM